MSNIDSKRQEHSLIPVPISQRDLLAIAGESLSEEQIKQIEKDTKAFLKQHKLPLSFETVNSVKPSVAQCIKDGLKQSKGSNEITFNDNLDSAFKIGFKLRIALSEKASEEYQKIKSGGKFRGELALPSHLTEGCLQELNNLPTKPQLLNSQALLEIIDKRRPVYKKLLSFTREEADKLIPGSKEIVITPEQEAGLVRNLIFSWVTQDRTNPLIETEDLIQGKATFVSKVDSIDKNKIAQLLTLIDPGLSQTPATFEYLLNLTQQVADYIQKIPQDISSLDDIGNVFRLLSSTFALAHPFSKLLDLSEDPADQGRSIWDPERSTIVKANHSLYRVPNPETLSHKAYTQDPYNPQRANDYQSAVRSVKMFIEEADAQQKDS
ncbi:MAG: hypothetical protein NUV73_01860, partial [Candidatus Daviesbacteria bacterium]|nr:hypothetical protein [Candidatus Daviesbacteria bacterium]